MRSHSISLRCWRRWATQSLTPPNGSQSYHSRCWCCIIRWPSRTCWECSWLCSVCSCTTRSVLVAVISVCSWAMWSTLGGWQRVHCDFRLTTTHISRFIILKCSLHVLYIDTLSNIHRRNTTKDKLKSCYQRTKLTAIAIKRMATSHPTRSCCRNSVTRKC